MSDQDSCRAMGGDADCGTPDSACSASRHPSPRVGSNPGERAGVSPDRARFQETTGRSGLKRGPTRAVGEGAGLPTVNTCRVTLASCASVRNSTGGFAKPRALNLPRQLPTDRFKGLIATANR